MNSQPPILTPEALEASMPAYQDVPIKGLGTVRVRALDLPEKLKVVRALDALEKDERGVIASQDDAIRAALAVLAVCLVDTEGRPVWDNEQGRAMIGRLALELQPAMDVALELNRLGRDALEEKKSS